MVKRDYDVVAAVFRVLRPGPLFISLPVSDRRKSPREVAWLEFRDTFVQTLKQFPSFDATHFIKETER